MQARVHSQGFHTPMSYLCNYPYFHTSHKVPDILIADIMHQVPFIAVGETSAGEESVSAECCTVKTENEEKAQV